MKEFKDVMTRYCPYVRQNVPTEVTYTETGKPVGRCLNSFRCPRTVCSIYMNDPENLTVYALGSDVPMDY